jgi:hypothetical protein
MSAHRIAGLGIAILLLGMTSAAMAQRSDNCTFKIGKLKYGGGGDWYSNPSSLPNLLKYIRQNTRANVCTDEEIVEAAAPQLFQYPMVYMTGHGNVVFTDEEINNLRTYLLGGGFLLADDNYGMQQYIRREMKKVFPESELREIGPGHPIYGAHFQFPNGLPKIHQHDGKPAQAFGIVVEGRLVCLITYECDLGDGWEDRDVHNDPETVRQKALQMGANIVLYVLQQ